MAKPGRPKGTTKISIDHKNISIRIPMDLYQKTTEAAEADGRKVSAYIRQVLAEKLN